MDDAPGTGATALPAGAVAFEAAWAELKLRLERSRGLCLVFLHADAAETLAPLRTRVDDAWAWRTAPLRLLRPRQPGDAAADILRSLQHGSDADAGVRAPVWIELLELDGSESEAWETARTEVLSRLNEWRSWLQAEFRRPLVVSLPVAWRRRVVEVAPDLWQVRACSMVVASATRAGPVAAGPDPADLLDRLRHDARHADAEPEAEAAIDWLIDGGRAGAAVELAREVVARRREAVQASIGQPVALRDLSVSLNKLGDAQRGAGQGAQALAAYRESLELRRELRRQLGDAPGALDDLAVSLERLAALDPADSADSPATPTPAGRRAWIGEAISLRRRLAQAFPDEPRWQKRLETALRIQETLED